MTSKTKFVFLLLAFAACKREVPVTKIAFGSCGHEALPQPILALAAAQKPDAFIYLGDNIYGDTDDMDTLRAKYDRLGAKKEFQQLASSAKILATWDDHDFGRNDAGREYPYKKESKEIFLQFFKEPQSSARRQHEGIYHAEYLKNGDKAVQILLLDVRTFRSNLTLMDKNNVELQKKYFYSLDYQPADSPDSTLLGAQQWKWLGEELRKPADVRLICSGSQFGIEFNGYEAWANFPREQQKMLNLIKETKANGVIFLTGDVHYAEISKLEEPDLYPIYDVTSSGITSTWHFATPNKNRIEGPVMENHFGLLTIAWTQDPRITMEIIDKNNNSRFSYEINLSQLQF